MGVLLKASGLGLSAYSGLRAARSFRVYGLSGALEALENKGLRALQSTSGVV